MLDPRMFRTQLEAVAGRLARRGFALDVATVERLEARRKEIQAEVQRLQQRRNELARRIGQAKAKGEDTTALMAEAGRLPEALKQQEAELDAVQAGLEEYLLGVPNLPHESVPDGASEADNVEVRRVGEPRRFPFAPKDHVEVGAALGMLDFEAAAKLAGARFAVMRAGLARLQRALIQFMLDLHTQEHGYEE